MKVSRYLARLCFFGFALGLPISAAEAASPSIVPEPMSLNLGVGSTSISDGEVIRYADPSLAQVAELLRSDLLLVHGLQLTVEAGGTVTPGGILLLPDASFPTNEQHRITVNGSVTLEAKGLDGFYAGTVSILQAITGPEGGKTIPNMTVEDWPFREFRSVMVDNKNHWYSVDDIKAMIRLCRFYKVNYFSLHTGEEQWIGALLDQTANYPLQTRLNHRLYTKAEMDDMIAFARSQGVRMFPHNESSRDFAGMRRAVATDLYEGDSYVNFIDEFDGQGPYTGDFNDARYWAFIEEMTRRGIDQFAAGYESGTLPYYHIGPVQGEGGMNRADAAKVVGFIQAKDPNVKAMFWNGIDGTINDSLSAYKSKIVIAYYMQWGGSNVHGYLNNGWEVVNAAWSPLYVVGSHLSRTQQQVHDDWNLFRTGTDGFSGNGFDYSAISWTLFDNPATNDQVLGGMLCTWEGPQNIQMDRLRPRVPAFIEHAWNHRPWPYLEGDYAEFASRYASTDVYLNRLLAVEPPTVPTRLTATDEVFADRIHLYWQASSQNPSGYKIYRGTTADTAAATLLDTVSDPGYIDSSVEAGTTYYYWVSAINGVGESALSSSETGLAGTANAPAKAYEPFNYTGTARLHGRNTGTGWASGWSQVGLNGTLSEINRFGLSYGELPVSGNSVRMISVNETPDVVINRSTAGTMGNPGLSTWTSFLLKAETAASGHLYVGFSGVKNGKGNGSQFGIENQLSGVNIAAGKTNFIVCQMVHLAGNDEMYLWVNPPLRSRPHPSTANLKVTNLNMNLGSAVQISAQGQGRGTYDLDEIRVGWDWLDVNGGLTNNQAPQPNLMTWISPPVLQTATSASMACTPATDDDGVEYYFEETSGNPGGDSSGWQSSPFYTDSGLQAGYSYSYRVKARDLSGDQLETAWSFIASVSLEAPGGVSLSGPDEGAVNVALDRQLAWTNGSGTTTSYAVYFGTTPELDSSHFKGNQEGATFNPGPLAPNTTYYWRIDSVNAYGTTTGPTWSFTTAGGPREIRVSGFSMQGNVATIRFVDEPGITTWQVKGSEDLASFDIDETGNSVITETQLGDYTAVVTLTSPIPKQYFLRVEKP
jgi:hypothetical protein